jgi:hypothetical protein
MPALIEAVPHEDGTAYQIVARSADEVQSAIFDIAEAISCPVHFENPHRAYSMLDGLTRWRARGFASKPTGMDEAMADMRAWQQRRRAGA